MIRRIFSSLRSFKTLELYAGLNILLAERSVGASERQTRNGAGKTSLVEIIHFLAGGSVDAKSLFRTAEFQDVAFGAEFDLASEPVVVERSSGESRRVYVSGSSSGWPIAPAVDGHDGRTFLTNADWLRTLGALWFGLRDGQEEAEAKPFAPSFRSLFSYFVRREGAGAFKMATQQNDKQAAADVQVNLSYLLGLDWRIPQQWEQVRQREQAIKSLRRALKEAGFGGLLPDVARLRSRLAIVERNAQALRRQLDEFRVLAEYHELEQEASATTRFLNDLANSNAIDEELIAELERAAQAEEASSETQLERVYAEAGVVLPERIQRRYDEVKAFHASVIANRRSYLESELIAARSRCEERRTQMAALDRRRGEIMAILRAHGALEQFSALQEEYARRVGEFEQLRRQFQMAEEIAATRARAEVERTQLHLRLQQDYHEQSSVLNDAILAFEDVSSALYERSGRLTISASDKGPSFEVSIHGGKSKGVNNMQIFCFDMMLMRVVSKRAMGPRFLVHDSHLFDGVDDRQVASALAIGQREAQELGFQYLVTFNSDAFERVAGLRPVLRGAVLPTRLSDAREDGGLFGFRFG
ncbi:MAG: hypothetical protein DIJKHBIC_00031 [Thermoanaerobaculia bacterium]|nr:hypothetical protein [Thermoanaerobaculia bacterium]